MVDPYQVLIDNGNTCEQSGTHEKKYLLPILTQNMNASDTSSSSHQLDGSANSIEITTTTTTHINQENNLFNEYSGNVGRRNEQLHESFEIMCGPSTATANQGHESATIAKVNDENSDQCKENENLNELQANAFQVPAIFQNGINSELTQDFNFDNVFDLTNDFSELNSVINETDSLQFDTDVYVTNQFNNALNDIEHLSDVSELNSEWCVKQTNEEKTVALPDKTPNSSSSSAVVINVVPQEARFTTLQEINDDDDDDEDGDCLKSSESQLKEVNKINHKFSVSNIEMDARKVEPLRININREPIKTKIKLTQNQSQDRTSATLSPTTKFQVLPPRQSGNDDVDNASGNLEPTPTFPKITIKPIVKPGSAQASPQKNKNDEHHHHHRHHHHHHHHQSHHQPYPNHHAQEAIPKLKIKVDSTSALLQNVSSFSATSSGRSDSSCSSNNNSNSSIISQTLSSPNSGDELQPPESLTVPKLTIRSTTNSLGGLSSNLSASTTDTCIVKQAAATANEIIPKFTIKRDNHSGSPLNYQQFNSNYNNSSNKEVSLMSDEGVKVTLKPICEPPLPKLTIKTNQITTHHSPTISSSGSSGIPKIKIKPIAEPEEIMDEHSSESESPDVTKDEIMPSSRLEHYSNQSISSTTTESSGPRTSYVSNSNSSGTDELKFIIKATSTGNCVINAATSSTTVGMNSQAKDSRQLLLTKSNSKTITSTTQDQLQASPVNSTSVETIPKLNIKFSSTQSQSSEESLRPLDNKTGGSTKPLSPVPKLTIRPIKPPEESIVIPKVTIKPLVNPDDDSDVICVEPPLVTPKIILKPIPKPIESTQLLEIVTATPSSPFQNSVDSESQRSPRIILKINKNPTSQTKEAIILTKPSTSTATDATADEDNRSETLSITENASLESSPDVSAASTPNDSKTQNFDSDIEINKEFSLSQNKEEEGGEEEEEEDDDDDDEIVQLLSSDSEPEASNHVEDKPECNPQLSVADTAVESTGLDINFEMNSGLRSMLSRPQMHILPPTQLFMQNLPPNTSDTTNINSEVIDLCNETNDSASRESMVNVTAVEAGKIVIDAVATSTETTMSSSTETATTNSINTEQNLDNKPKWSFLYNEPVKPQPVHPLLQQNIARANILEAMMNAANAANSANKEPEPPVSHTSNGNNNNSTSSEQFDFLAKKKSELLLDNDGSSSDCIVIEDTNSTTDFTAVTTDKLNEQNGQKKDSADRDSGVDVSSSVKLIPSDIRDEEPTPSKRPRGRPRKDGTPARSIKKQKANDVSKRKFASALMSEHIATADLKLDQMTVNLKSTTELPNNLLTMQPEISETATTITSSIMSVTATDEPVVTTAESIKSADSQQSSAVLTDIIAGAISDHSMNITQINIDNRISESSIIESITTTSTQESMVSMQDTPVATKERKRRIIIDDDDESPTFNPLNRGIKRMRGRGRGSRGRGLLRKKMHLIQSPEKSIDANVFTSPEGIDQSRRKLLSKDVSSSALQVFEEDTRMSADSLFTSPIRTTEFLQNEESQSSLHSSTSATIEGSARKQRSKIEVVDPEGKTEFTVDMIAEYDWPPPKGCCPARNRDTYMIQEQIAEYLGVKSFKRKYPDLPRRMVEMEERNYLMEKGMVSEKMCDLGLTAVLASDVLDIMHTDFYEKYEDYRKYLREKQIRDLAARQKHQQAEAYEKNLSARDSAIRAVSLWNSNFNKSRKENRRECLDLQTFTIQRPEPPKDTENRPVSVIDKPTHYPVALVPGQFQEYYHAYSAAELLCYPINTVIADPIELDRRIRAYFNKKLKIDSESESESDSDSSSSSDDSDSSSTSDDSDSSSDSSSSDNEDIKPNTSLDVKPFVPSPPKRKPIDKKDKGKCRICNGPPRLNKENKPEIFVKCTVCRREAHPSCVNMSSRMVKRINEYAWQCRDCKYCIKCRRSDNDDKIVFCEQCDRCYHIYCIGLRKVPIDRWHCSVCTVCTMCGARRPEGHNNPNLTPQQKLKLLAVAKWTHEYQLNQKTNLREHSSMLCTSCVALKNSVVAKNVYLN